MNRNHSQLPGVKLGYEIRDSCSDRGTAVAQTLNFLPKFNAQECPVVANGKQPGDNSTDKMTSSSLSMITSPGNFTAVPVVGVVGQ